MLDKSLHIVANIVIIGSVIITMIYNINPKYNIVNYFIKDDNLKKIFYIGVGLCGLYLLSKRETFLPFLGESVVPSSLFEEKNNNDLEKMLTEKSNNAISLTVYAPNSDKVIWWASKPDDSTIAPTYDIAYDEYKNSGVSNVQSDGNAYITLPCPQQYNVNNKKLPKHLHFREANGAMLSEVKTINLSC